MSNKFKLLSESVEKINQILEDIGVSKEILEKEVKSFGNGGHVILSRKYLNKKVKIIIG